MNVNQFHWPTDINFHVNLFFFCYFVLYHFMQMIKILFKIVYKLALSKNSSNEVRINGSINSIHEHEYYWAKVIFGCYIQLWKLGTVPIENFSSFDCITKNRFSSSYQLIETYSKIHSKKLIKSLVVSCLMHECD